MDADAEHDRAAEAADRLAGEFRRRAREHGVDLDKLDVPYRCGACGAYGVRLWRKYQTVLDAQTLLCRACAETEQGLAGQDYGQDRGDQIGWRIPAVPDDTGTYWGYTSVPDEGVAWWVALPEVAP